MFYAAALPNDGKRVFCATLAFNARSAAVTLSSRTAGTVFSVRGATVSLDSRSAAVAFETMSADVEFKACDHEYS
jgi:hypothetical protein